MIAKPWGNRPSTATTSLLPFFLLVPVAKPAKERSTPRKTHLSTATIVSVFCWRPSTEVCRNRSCARALILLFHLPLSHQLTWNNGIWYGNERNGRPLLRLLPGFTNLHGKILVGTAAPRGVGGTVPMTIQSQTHTNTDTFPP